MYQSTVNTFAIDPESKQQCPAVFEGLLRDDGTAMLSIQLNPTKSAAKTMLEIPKTMLTTVASCVKRMEFMERARLGLGDKEDDDYDDD